MGDGSLLSGFKGQGRFNNQKLLWLPFNYNFNLRELILGATHRISISCSTFLLYAVLIPYFQASCFTII